MATGLDAVLRNKAKPWARYVALDTVEYIKDCLLGEGYSGSQDREGWGAEGQSQLFDVLAAQIEAVAGAMAAKERAERG
eukprot:2508595-Alexandrium_andersonii.AAC.1